MSCLSWITTRGMRSLRTYEKKKEASIAKVLPALLDKAEAMGRAARPDLEANQRAINSIRSDNGGEFKGQVLDILKERKIKNTDTVHCTDCTECVRSV